MGTRLGYLLVSVRESFWFLPAVMTGLAVGLSFATVAVDRAFAEDGEHALGWTYRGGPDGARGVLSTIAASMITVAGVVFSITVVALSLASSQFGPRLLRNFIRDRGNQVVLGTFVATFVYCLLVLRTVNGTDTNTFVPEVGVTAGVAMALLSLGVLIYFIHHIAQTIQASNVVGRVGDELLAMLDELYPEELGDGAGTAPESDTDPPAGAEPVGACVEGYVLEYEADALMRAAAEHDLVVYLPLPPGRFVLRGDAVVWVVAGRALDPAARDALGRAVVVGPQRTGYRDAEFATRQLTEVAVRALSPSVNDPFTAVECVHRLGQAFARLAARSFPSPHRLGPDGRVRVVARGLTFPTLLGVALDPILHHGRRCPLVLVAARDALAAVAARATRPADRAAVARLAARTARAVHDLGDPDDREWLLGAGETPRVTQCADDDDRRDGPQRNGEGVPGAQRAGGD